MAYKPVKEDFLTRIVEVHWTSFSLATGGHVTFSTPNQYGTVLNASGAPTIPLKPVGLYIDSAFPVPPMIEAMPMECICLDKAGDIIVGNTIFGPLNVDVVNPGAGLVKYSKTTGAVLWTRLFVSGPDISSTVSVGADKDNNIYVAWSNFVFSSSVRTSHLTKFSPGGGQIWDVVLDVGESIAIGVYTSTTSPSGITVVGVLFEGGSFAYRCYSPLGNLMWAQSFEGPIGGLLAPHSTDEFFVHIQNAGSMVSRRRMATGSPVWGAAVSEFAFNVDVGEDEDVFVFGETGADIYLQKIDHLGTPGQKVTFGGDFINIPGTINLVAPNGIVAVLFEDAVQGEFAPTTTKTGHVRAYSQDDLSPAWDYTFGVNRRSPLTAIGRGP